MPAPDYQTLYKFEELLSATLADLFNAAELTSKGMGDAPQLQSARPRVEVFVTAGARFDNHYVLDAQGLRRENGWNGSLTLTAITAAEPQIHSAYIGAIRAVCAILDQADLADLADIQATLGLTAAVPLQFHEIGEIKTAGAHSVIEPEKGDFHTRLNYNFNFAIRPDAWPGGLFQK